MPRLGVNIDHIATLREARKTTYPDPFDSLATLKKCGVDQVTCHLREDRRHIKDHDIERIMGAHLLPVNLEMAVTNEMVMIAKRLKPATCTLVPEKREEITTEGGLDLVSHFDQLRKIIPSLVEAGIRVSLFIDPEKKQIDCAGGLGVPAVELHTGSFCEAFAPDRNPGGVIYELARLQEAATLAKKIGLSVFAGHGLNRDNLPSLVRLKTSPKGVEGALPPPLIEEYNIGHSIIARAVFVGLAQAVREIQGILKG